MAASLQTASSVTLVQPSSTANDFLFPWQYSFPAFFSLQPIAMSRSAQLTTWSELILDYCRHYRIFFLSVVDALNTQLFNNEKMRRKLTLRDANAVLSWMATAEGGNRAEFFSTNAKKKAEEGVEGGNVWIYWRRPEEWAIELEEWVDRTGQKGTVLTLYEIAQGDASQREEFYNMDMDLLQKSLAICVKRGKAQVFGSEGSEGVKFF